MSNRLSFNWGTELGLAMAFVETRRYKLIHPPFDLARGIQIVVNMTTRTRLMEGTTPAAIHGKKLTEE